MNKVAFFLVHYFQTCLKSLAFYFVCLLIYLVIENEQIFYNPQIWTLKFANNLKLKTQNLQKLKWNSFLESKVISPGQKIIQVLVKSCFKNPWLSHGNCYIVVRVLLPFIIKSQFSCCQLSYELVNCHFISYPVSYEPIESCLRSFEKLLESCQNC